MTPARLGLEIDTKANYFSRLEEMPKEASPFQRPRNKMLLTFSHAATPPLRSLPLRAAEQELLVSASPQLEPTTSLTALVASLSDG